MTFIVAELSANHSKDWNTAVKLIYAAKKAGADAVKLQTYTPDTLTIKCDSPDFQIKSGTLWDGRTLYDLYGEAYMNWKWHIGLKKIADDIGIELFSTPFDKTSVDFLESLDVKRYKVASFEIVDITLIKYIASKDKPIIMSTGMASKTEIKEAIEACSSNTQITLLKCTSDYPAKPEEMNLRTIHYLMDSFMLPVGLSDHTLSIEVPVLAVALGATVIEKHFTLSRLIDTPDKAFSLEPAEFKQMVDKIRMTEKILGDYGINITEQEIKNKVFRRSLYVIEDVKGGEIITNKNVKSIRPGYGLSPKYLDEVIGTKAKVNIRKGTPLSWELISR
jgi:pseudaminic acid synthase